MPQKVPIGPKSFFVVIPKILSPIKLRVVMKSVLNRQDHKRRKSQIESIPTELHNQGTLPLPSSRSFLNEHNQHENRSELCNQKTKKIGRLPTISCAVASSVPTRYATKPDSKIPRLIHRYTFAINRASPPQLRWGSTGHSYSCSTT